MGYCTLCGSKEILPVDPSRDSRSYYHCRNCHLIFVDRRYHLPKETERSRYTLHQNGVHNEGYVAFLQRVIQPCLPFLTPQMRGLDYGCGPAPTLSKVLADRHLVCYDYDPLFGFTHPHQEYDFIFATECFEHFFLPGKEFANIDGLLTSKGYLAIMTEQWETPAQFREWYYKRDPTHVSFFHRKTFSYICANFGYQIKYAEGNRIIILQKL